MHQQFVMEDLTGDVTPTITTKYLLNEYIFGFVICANNCLLIALSGCFRWTTHTSPRESGLRDAGNNWRDGEKGLSVCLYIPPIRRLSG